MPKPKKNESKQDFLKRCTAEVIKNEGRNADQAYAMCNKYWGDEKNERPPFTLAAPMQMAKKDAAAEASRSFLITAYTGQPLDTWFGKIVIDVAGIEAKEKIPVLREHKRDRVVGFSIKTWHDTNNFYLKGDFSESTRDGKEVKKLAEEGFPWQASVGIQAREVKILEDEQVTEKVNGQDVKGPAEIWEKSLVGEVSFVALGRDDNTAAIVLSRDPEEMAPVELVRSAKASHTADKEVGMTLSEILNRRALDLVKAENLEYSTALRRVINENPDLASQLEVYEDDKRSRIFSKFIEEELRAGHHIDRAIRLAVEKHPEEYQAFLDSLTE